MGYTPPFLDVRKVSGGYTVYAPSSTTTDDITIYPNTTDANAFIKLEGGGNVIIQTTAGGVIKIQDSGANDRIWQGCAAASTHNHITSKTTDYDLALLTTGTGVLKFGTYTAGAATDSTGYITIKDAAGNTRKLMVQA